MLVLSDHEIFGKSYRKKTRVQEEDLAPHRLVPGPEARRLRGAHQPRHRHLPEDRADGGGRRGAGLPPHRIRRRRQALRLPGPDHHGAEVHRHRGEEARASTPWGRNRHGTGSRRRSRSPSRRSRPELIKIYSARRALKGFQFPPDTLWQEEFESQFELRGDPGPDHRHRGREGRHGEPRSPWTGSSAATWASARPRWPSGPPSRRSWRAGRWRCWCPPRCSRCSISPPSRSASPATPSRST